MGDSDVVPSPSFSSSAGLSPLVVECGDYDTLVFCAVCGAPLYEAITEEGPGKLCNSCGTEFVPLLPSSQLSREALPGNELSRSISRAKPIEKKNTMEVVDNEWK